MSDDTNLTAAIDRATITSVYSGRNGKCCCGCAGKHSIASAFVDAKSKSRGYAVEADEINDRMVTRVVGLINSAPDAKMSGAPGFAPHYFAVIGNRLYIAYTD